MLLAATVGLKTFTYALMDEWHDGRMNSDRPAGSFGLLHCLLADDWALIRTTAKAYDDMMSDNEMASRITLRHENDDVDISLKLRSTRGLVIRSSGQYWHRFNEHHKDSPSDLVVAQDKAGQGEFQERDAPYGVCLAKRVCVA